MQKIAKFYKVDFSQFQKDWESIFETSDTQQIYDKIILPKRATTGSAGYDFFCPCQITIAPNQTITIPTGIRVKIETGWTLSIFPRSGLGFKYCLQLNNTVGIIDSDYYYSSNQGHIFVRMTNRTNQDKTIHLQQGEGFAQGIFLQYGLTEDDNTTAVRNGGFGSTTKA